VVFGPAWLAILCDSRLYALLDSRCNAEANIAIGRIALCDYDTSIDPVVDDVLAHAILPGEAGRRIAACAILKGDR